MVRRSRLLMLACFAGCDTSNVSPRADGGADASDASNFSFDGAALDVEASSPLPDVPPDAALPPEFACVDGGDAGECPLPTSFCLNTRWLEYFDDGVCLDGGCQFTGHLHECTPIGEETCFNNGCISLRTQ